MEPTAGQIEKVARIQVPMVYDILDVESVDEIDRIALSWFEAWEQVVPRMQWQPIKTAPKDARCLMLAMRTKLTDSGYYVDIGKWSARYDGWHTTCGQVRPTHWMLLPDPPQAHLTIKDEKGGV